MTLSTASAVFSSMAGQFEGLRDGVVETHLFQCSIFSANNFILSFG